MIGQIARDRFFRVDNLNLSEWLIISVREMVVNRVNNMVNRIIIWNNRLRECIWGIEGELVQNEGRMISLIMYVWVFIKLNMSGSLNSFSGKIKHSVGFRHNGISQEYSFINFGFKFGMLVSLIQYVTDTSKDMKVGDIRVSPFQQLICSL